VGKEVGYGQGKEAGKNEEKIEIAKQSIKKE